jgi:hypothetical protein
MIRELMESRKAEVKAVVERALLRLVPLLEVLEDPPDPIPYLYWPPPPYPNTPSQIRRTIKRFREGKVRPVDPSIDPLMVADMAEKHLNFDTAREQLDDEIDILREELNALMDHREAKAADEALEMFYDSRDLDKDPMNPLGSILLRLRPYIWTKGRSHRRERWVTKRVKAGVTGMV